MRNNSIVGLREVGDSPALGLFLKDRAKFLNFVRASVHELSDAEEILQRASLKILSRSATLRDPSRAEAWIYRLLRNEISDHFRRVAVRSRRTSDLTPDLLADSLSANDTHRPNLCPCAIDELPNLHPNYADALISVEMNGETIAAHAARKGISVNSATVRLHRARKALRVRLEARCGPCAGAGCFDCGCTHSAAPGSDH